MSRVVLCWICSGLLLASAAAAAESKPKAKPRSESTSESRLGKEIRIPANLGIATNVSPDEQAATILFDNLYVELNPVRGSTRGTQSRAAVETKIATIHIPYATDQRSVRMAMDLRGFLSTGPGAAARLVACAGDATQVVDLDCEDKKEIKLKGKAKCKLVPKEEVDDCEDWQDRIEFTVQTHAAKPVLQVTLFLLLEQDTDQADSGGGLLVVDSLDLEIAKRAKASYGR